jgi:hypothetical protein
MLVSPFTFYRGAALVMAADLARTDFTHSGNHRFHQNSFDIFAGIDIRLHQRFNIFALPFEDCIKQFFVSGHIEPSFPFKMMAAE